MQITDKFLVINIRELITKDKAKLGEKNLDEILSEFSCPLNPDVERFLKHSAVEFTKKNQSVTYLVFNRDNCILLGYFTLALKPLTVHGSTISNAVGRKLARISEVNEQMKTYTMAAYLIAQLGKNFVAEAEHLITGKDILDLAQDRLLQAQCLCGGVVTFLETYNEEKLLLFYDRNLFRQFDVRQKILPDGTKYELVQLLRLF